MNSWVDRPQGIGYHERMRWVRTVVLALGMAGFTACAYGHGIDHVPLDRRLDGLYGHARDVARPHDTPRNIDWENERLAVTLRVGHYLARHPELPAPMANALSKQELVAGLTKEQVQLVWGPPTGQRHRGSRRHPTTKDVWYYRVPPGQRWGGQTYRLEFTDGIVERITAP